MIMPKWLLRKAFAELQTAYALVKYSVAKDALIERLAHAIPSVAIETTNICNADCVFCAYQYQERATGVMSMELFKKIIDEYDDVGGGSIGLTPTVGDPLVDKHIVERIRYARGKKNIKTIGMHSNMIALERTGADALVLSGINALSVSTSGFDKDMYERVYRSKEYPRALRNILAFAKANNAAGTPVDFRIELRVDRSFGEVASSKDYQTVAEAVGADRMLIKFRYDNWAGKISQEDLSGNMKLRSHVRVDLTRISPCSEMYSGPVVYWDGKVGACGCRDVDARELIIGDATKSHIAEIWMGEEIRRLREEFLTPAVRPICTSCTHYQNLSIFLRPDRTKLLAAIKPVSGFSNPPATRKSADL